VDQILLAAVAGFLLGGVIVLANRVILPRVRAWRGEQDNGQG